MITNEITCDIIARIQCCYHMHFFYETGPSLILKQYVSNPWHVLQYKYKFHWAVTQNISTTLAVLFSMFVAGLTRLGPIVNIMICQICKTNSQVNWLFSPGKYVVMFNLIWFRFWQQWISVSHKTITANIPANARFLIKFSGDWNIFINEKVNYRHSSIATRTINVSL